MNCFVVPLVWGRGPEGAWSSSCKVEGEEGQGGGGDLDLGGGEGGEGGVTTTGETWRILSTIRGTVLRARWIGERDREYAKRRGRYVGVPWFFFYWVLVDRTNVYEEMGH